VGAEGVTLDYLLHPVSSGRGGFWRRKLGWGRWSENEGEGA